MYSLKCNYYTNKFNTIQQLIDDIILTGMDPNYELTLDGKPTGILAIDYIQF
jgi:hypothetical protein